MLLSPLTIFVLPLATQPHFERSWVISVPSIRQRIWGSCDVYQVGRYDRCKAGEFTSLSHIWLGATCRLSRPTTTARPPHCTSAD